MAARLKDDGVQFEQALVVHPKGLRKLEKAVKTPKEPTLALVRLMAGRYDARKLK